MKIIKSEDRYVESAKLEINVLKKIRDADADKQYSCIALLEDFMYKGHPCLRNEIYFHTWIYRVERSWFSKI